jgi:hypothetical protein
VISGWALYLLLGPLSLFLTWYGDCLADPCPAAGRLDEAIYVFDVLWWIAFPALAWFAYQGARWAWAALLAVAIVLDLQIVAAIVGARGFSAFFFTLPAVAVLTFGAGLGLAMTAAPGPRPGGCGDDGPAGLDRLPRGRRRDHRPAGPARRRRRAAPRRADPDGDRPVRHRDRGRRQPRRPPRRAADPATAAPLTVWSLTSRRGRAR